MEIKDPYYRHIADPRTAEHILREFGLSGEGSHIVNGHVPVRAIEGESPIKGGGRLIIIDGGFCRAYHRRTGKETNSKTSFALANIHMHQIKHLINVKNKGAIAFIIVRFNLLDETYFLSVENLEEFIKNNKRKSIPLDFFKNYGTMIKIKYAPVGICKFSLPPYQILHLFAELCEVR